MIDTLIEKAAAFIKRRPVEVIGSIVGVAGAVNEHVVATVDPTDGWKPVAVAVLVYFGRKLIATAEA